MRLTIDQSTGFLGIADFLLSSRLIYRPYSISTQRKDLSSFRRIHIFVARLSFHLHKLSIKAKVKAASREVPSEHGSKCT